MRVMFTSGGNCFTGEIFFGMLFPVTVQENGSMCLAAFIMKSDLK